MWVERLLVFAAGLYGAAGVGLSAVAAHVGGGNIETAAGFLLAHAPVLLLLGLIGSGLFLRWGAISILVGLTLFCCDLLARHYFGARLFPMAAPLGGIAMITGWLAIAASALGGRPMLRDDGRPMQRVSDGSSNGSPIG